VTHLQAATSLTPRNKRVYCLG